MRDDLLILDPANPFDFGEGGLRPLADELEGRLGGEVRVHLRTEEGYGGPLPEVLAIWEAATNQLEHGVTITAVGAFLRERWKREKDLCGPDEEPRDRSATGYDTSGTPRWSIRIGLPDGAIVEIEDQDPAQRPAPPDLDRPDLDGDS